MGIIQRQSIQTSLISYAGAALGYLNFVLLYPYFLSATDVGLIRAIISIAAMAAQFSMLGSVFTLQRFFPYFNNAAEKHFGIFTYVLRMSAVGFAGVCLLMWLFRNDIQNFFLNQSPMLAEHFGFVFPLAFLMMAFEVFFFYARVLLLAVLPTFAKEVLLRLIQTALLVIYMVTDISLQSFLWIFVGAYVLHLAVLVLYLRFKRQLFLIQKLRLNDIVPVRQLNRYGIFIFIGSLAYIFTSNIDVVILSARAGLADTAVYSVAFFIGTLVIVPSRAMNQVAVPFIAEAWKNNDLGLLHRLYKQTANAQMIVGSFIVLMLLYNTAWLLNLLPPVYQQAELAVYIIAFGRLLDVSTGINGELIYFSKHVRFNMATNFLLIAITGTSMWFLVGWWGVVGAAVAVPIAYFFYNAVRMLFLWQRYKMHPFRLKNLAVFGLLLLFAFIRFTLPVDFQHAVLSIAMSSAVAIVFATITIRFNLSNEITAFWMSIRKRLGQKRNK